jgi:hypothetical protein
MLCDGTDFQYHAIDSTAYVTGPLSPGAAPVSSSTTSRATATLTFTTDPENNDSFNLTGKSGFIASIYFKTTLATTRVSGVGNAVQIKCSGGAGSPATTVANIAAFFNNTGIEGTEYFVLTADRTAAEIRTLLGINVSSAVSPAVTFRAVDYGSSGNGYLGTEITDSGADWSITNFSGGSAGTHAASTWPVAGTYLHAIARVRSGDRAQTAISPRSTLTQTGDYDMSVGTFGTPPTRDNITHTRVFRSTVNGGEQFYKEGDTTAASYTDSLPDSTIVGEGALLYDSSKFRPYAAGYPTRRKYGALYRGSVYLTGVIPEAQRTDGTVTVTVGSFAFAFSGTKYKTDIIGRTLRFGSETNEYVVVDFTESSQSGLLGVVYAGALAGGGATYTLTDDRNAFGVEWCVPNKINQFPVSNSLEGVSSPDGAGTTGIEAAFDSLVLWTRTGLWQIQGDPSSAVPRFVPVCEGVGAWCGQAVVNADGLLYWLGPDGIWGWDGSGSPQSISNPSNPEAGSPRGIGDTLARINGEQVNGIVSDYNRTENVIRWFVPMDGSTWNNKVVVYDTQTGAFSVDDCPPVTCAASIVGRDGDYHTLVGTAFGEVWELGLSTSDGAYEFDPLQSHSSYAAKTKTVTVGSSALPTTGDGLKGVLVTKVAANSWPPEIGVVSANTASTFATVSPFSTTPAAGDKYVFGGIGYRIQTGKCDFGLPEMPKRLASVVVSFTPQGSTTQGQLFCGASVDDSDPVAKPLRSTALPGWADLTSSLGRHLFVTNTAEGSRTQFELYALLPGFDVSVASWKCEIPTRVAVRA